MKKTILLIGVLLVAGCASTTIEPSSTAGCPAPSELIGTWRSYRFSGLGPAWMTITLNCDCTGRVVSQLLFMRYTEDVPYRVEAGEVVFTRQRAETRWPYSFSGDRLVISESSSEHHPYRRVGKRPQCNEVSEQFAPKADRAPAAR